MGQLDRLRTELPENAEPLVPKRWSELNTMTIAFGQGLNVAPMQAVMAVSRAGERRPHDAADLPAAKRRRRPTRSAARWSATRRRNRCAISCARTRLTARRVSPTFPATMSAARPARPTRSFTAIIRRTRYSPPSWRSRRPTSRNISFLTLYDEPQPAPGDHGYHTAAWNAGRVAGALIRRIEPLEGVPPSKDAPIRPFPIIARLGYGADADKTGKE